MATGAPPSRNHIYVRVMLQPGTVTLLSLVVIVIYSYTVWEN